MAAPARPLERLVADRLRGVSSACVASSGGVDSSVVLAVAARALGAENVVAVTVVAPVMIPGEDEAAARLAGELGVAHVRVAVPLLDEPAFVANGRDRCYVCKGMVLDAVRAVAAERGCDAVVDGANRDDLGDVRPGMRAADERGVRHPLVEAGLGKEDVRGLARDLGLAIWDAPAQACLASRIPYGERISDEALRRIAAAEGALHELGFRACRVRAHGRLARVEVPAAEIGRAGGARREEIARRLRALGFTWVALDLDGLRTGSLNEAPPADRPNEAPRTGSLSEAPLTEGSDATPHKAPDAGGSPGGAAAPPGAAPVVP